MPLKQERATGIIKKVFFKKQEPYGYLSFVTPPELSGLEAVFSLKHNLCRSDEMKVYQHRILVDFIYMKKPRGSPLPNTVPYVAEEVRPLDPAEYSATVIHGPGTSGSKVLACLDVSLRRVFVTEESYHAMRLEEPLLPGDSCTIRVDWRELVSAPRERLLPMGEIVAVGNRRSNLAERSLLKHAESAVENSSVSAPEENCSRPILHRLKGVRRGTQNEFDAFCRSIAIQLKKMSPRRALICQRKLLETMISERLAILPPEDPPIDEDSLSEIFPHSSSDELVFIQDTDAESDCST